MRKDSQVDRPSATSPYTIAKSSRRPPEQGEDAGHREQRGAHRGDLGLDRELGLGEGDL
jgi:hypothetical protein